MFTLNDTQRAKLASIRAFLDEGERRYDFWSRREAQASAAQNFGETIAESGLRSGRSLTDRARRTLLEAAAELAPNGNLSRRLTAQDPSGFDDRLRNLLFGSESLLQRIETFVAVRGTGMLTTSGLLCVSSPNAYPLVTQTGLRSLGLTPPQRREALLDAAERYDFELPQNGQPGLAQRLLSLFVVYEQVRATLQLTGFPEVDAALRIALPLDIGTLAARIHEPGTVYAADSRPALTETALLTALEEYALGQGLNFPAHRLRSYYIALKTRPFAILSGVSGTGKTRMAELLAEALTGYSAQQFRLIPVRPDWNDSTALFGYQNILANRYVSTPFLEIARAASQPENRRKAYFVCLDEMNLAPVEHYLADYLSGLESRAHRIPLHEGVPDLILPNNLFVTGTVNVDESTHGFSRKVLDRANTLEFDESPPLAVGPAGKGVITLDEMLGSDAAQRQALFLASRVAGFGRAKERLTQIETSFPELALMALQTINDLLYAHRLHFAYRVRDDVLMYLANSFDAETRLGLLQPDAAENFTLALDLQILQKVLPKLHGLSETRLPLLKQVQQWAANQGLSQSAAKLTRMRHLGLETGYVRFYE